MNIFKSLLRLDIFLCAQEYVSERFPKDKLASIDDYEPIAKVIDYVNNSLS